MTLYTLDGDQPELHRESWVAETASVIGKVKLARGASIWFGVVARGDNELITLSRNTNVQDGSVLHTDIGFALTIGPGCTIGHMAMLHGCVIGDNTLVGIGATVLNGVSIGRNCLIGAHALILEGKEIPDNSLVMGMPGKVVRELSDDEIEMNRASALHYVSNWQRYKAGLRALSATAN